MACAEPRALQQLSRDPSTAVRCRRGGLRRSRNGWSRGFFAGRRTPGSPEAPRCGVNDLPLSGLVRPPPPVTALYPPVSKKPPQRLRRKRPRQRTQNPDPNRAGPVVPTLLRRAVNALRLRQTTMPSPGWLPRVGGRRRGAAQRQQRSGRRSNPGRLQNPPDGSRDRVMATVGETDVAAATRAVRANR